MTDVWVCTNCKSINRQRDTRCYSCGNRKDEVAAPDEQAPTDRLEAAIAYRARRGYTPSWPLGLIAGILIAAVAALGVYIIVEQYRELGPLKDAIAAAMADNDSARLQQIVTELSSTPAQQWHGPVTVLAVLAFGAWLAKVNTNIPLLGGGVPSWSPVKGFLYPIIPIVNLIKVPGYVQDALYRLDPSAGGFFMVLGALLGLVGSWLVGIAGSFVIVAGAVGQVVAATSIEEVAAIFGALLDQSFFLGLVTELMTAGGAILLAAIIWRVERRAGARNAEIEAAVLADPRFNPPEAAPAAPAAPPVATGGPATSSPAGSLDDVPLAAAGAPVVPAAPVPVPAEAVAPAAAQPDDSVPAATPDFTHQPRSGVPVYRPTLEPAAAPPPPAAPPAPTAPADDQGPMLPPPPPA